MRNRQMKCSNGSQETLKGCNKSHKEDELLKFENFEKCQMYKRDAQNRVFTVFIICKISKIVLFNYQEKDYLKYNSYLHTDKIHHKYKIQRKRLKINAKIQKIS